MTLETQLNNRIITAEKQTSSQGNPHSNSLLAFYIVGILIAAPDTGFTCREIHEQVRSWGYSYGLEAIRHTIKSFPSAQFSNLILSQQTRRDNARRIPCKCYKIIFKK